MRFVSYKHKITVIKAAIAKKDVIYKNLHVWFYNDLATKAYTQWRQYNSACQGLWSLGLRHGIITPAKLMGINTHVQQSDWSTSLHKQDKGRSWMNKYWMLMLMCVWTYSPSLQWIFFLCWDLGLRCHFDHKCLKFALTVNVKLGSGNTSVYNQHIMGDWSSPDNFNTFLPSIFAFAYLCVYTVKLKCPWQILT